MSMPELEELRNKLCLFRTRETESRRKAMDAADPAEQLALESQADQWRLMAEHTAYLVREVDGKRETFFLSPCR